MGCECRCVYVVVVAAVVDNDNRAVTILIQFDVLRNLRYLTALSETGATKVGVRPC